MKQGASKMELIKSLEATMTVLEAKRKPNEDVKRRFFIDKYNDKKLWEVAYLNGTSLIRQYIQKNNEVYQLVGKGSRRNKKELEESGILDFEEITNVNFVKMNGSEFEIT